MKPGSTNMEKRIKMNSIKSQIQEEELRRLIELRFHLKKLLLRICFETEYTLNEFKRSCKKPEIADIRAAYFQIAKESFPDASHSLIGSMINRDHSTVTAGIKKVNNVKEVRKVYENLLAKLNESLLFKSE